MPTPPPIHQIIRSRRRSFAIVVNPQGEVIVRAPLRATRAQAEAVVAQHAEWVRRKQAEMQARAAEQPPSKTFSPGETFLYQGMRYPLVIAPHQRELLTFDGATFSLAERARPKAAAVFTAWYQAEARRVLSERAALYAAQYNLTFTTLRISNARTRWGSCGRSSLNFSWRLVLAPLPVLDYVVLHELAHLIHRNHSPAFWAQVAAWMPDYARHRAWLKAHGGELRVE